MGDEGETVVHQRAGAVMLRPFWQDVGDQRRPVLGTLPTAAKAALPQSWNLKPTAVFPSVKFNLFCLAPPSQFLFAFVREFKTIQRGATAKELPYHLQASCFAFQLSCPEASAWIWLLRSACLCVTAILYGLGFGGWGQQCGMIHAGS